MAKQEPIRVDAIVKDALPNAMFRVEVDLAGKKHTVLAQVCGKMRMHFIKVLPGDRVTVEVSPYDLDRGRIVMRN